ncbi:MAG: hypothetical protein ACTSRC_18760 [Candidatus Helarchaeota archaeon]
MIDLTSIIMIVAFFMAFVASALLALKFWVDLTNIKNDSSEYVYCIDLRGNIKKLGINMGIGIENNKYTIRTSMEAETIDWLLDLGLKYNLEGISIHYRSNDGHVNMTFIFTDFFKSDFKNKKIVPLIHKDILKLGLSEGFRMISERSNPLYEQIEELRWFNAALLKEIQELNIENDKKYLENIRAIKYSNKGLLDEVMQEYMTAPDYLRRRIRLKRKEYFKSPETLKEPEGATKIQDDAEAAEATSKLPVSQVSGKKAKSKGIATR